MNKELGGSGTPFGYTDPDLYEQHLDGPYNIYVITGVAEEPTEGATILLAHYLMTGVDLTAIRDGEVEQ